MQAPDDIDDDDDDNNDSILPATSAAEGMGSVAVTTYAGA